MLKKLEKYDIIYTVRWDYMNNNILISTSMLAAYWESNRHDTFDLLTPFIKYAIAKTTSVGAHVRIEEISKYLKSNFGYETMPMHIIKLILKRLSPNVLHKEKNGYILAKNIDEEVEKIEKRQLQFKEQREKVVAALSEYLNSKYVTKHNYDPERTMNALIDFFVVNGLTIMREPEKLELLKYKDDQQRYHIAQFVIEEVKKDSSIFHYILDMVKGFFVSTVISLQPKNTSISLSKFKGLKCFIDTSIILSALGLHSSAENEAAKGLLDMLREKGADLYCYNHTYEEIRDIIYAYKKGLENPRKSHQYHTLVGWDERKYTSADVDMYLPLLKNKILPP